MNVEKIFNALKDDDQNSGLGIICADLESQGYIVSIDGISVKSGGFFEGKYEDLESRLGPLKISLFRDGKLEQKFAVEFIDFHDLNIKAETYR